MKVYTGLFAILLATFSTYVFAGSVRHTSTGSPQEITDVLIGGFPKQLTIFSKDLIYILEVKELAVHGIDPSVFAQDLLKADIWLTCAERNCKDFQLSYRK